jgi:shikimate dehydrogenase
LAAIIGDPVDHSLSPVLHNAAFAALGLDWVYLALRVSQGEVAEAIGGVRALGLAGLSVTMPHKAAVAAEMDDLSATAARLGAVNTVVRRGRDLVGDNTDGAGLLDALRADQGWQPEGRRCVVLGAGGAARGVALALGEAGAAKVSVVARRPEAAHAVAALAGAVGLAAPVGAVAGADLVVNATPVGMSGVDIPLGLDIADLGPGQLVVDLIYSPPSTALLDAARMAGAAAVNGLGMLIHQAAHQFRLWTGLEPPLAVMSAAAVAAISGHAPPAESEVGL